MRVTIEGVALLLSVQNVKQKIVLIVKQGKYPMPRFRGQIDALDINVQEYENQMNVALMAIFEKAANAFVETAVKRVAVMTGMSLGSFIDLADRVGVPLDFSSPYSAEQLKSQKWYYGRGGRIPKTPESGLELTTFVLEMREGRPVFIFDAKTLQYGLQEFGAGRPSTQIDPPWESLIFGRNAFLRYLRDHLLQDLPDLLASITITRYSFGRGQNVAKVKFPAQRRQKTLRQ